jgi:hypothetical protein
MKIVLPIFLISFFIWPFIQIINDHLTWEIYIPYLIYGVVQAFVSLICYFFLFYLLPMLVRKLSGKAE